MPDQDNLSPFTTPLIPGTPEALIPYCLHEGNMWLSENLTPLAMLLGGEIGLFSTEDYTTNEPTEGML